MKSTHITRRLNLGVARLRTASVDRDWASIAREERELRALAHQLAAHANWQAAEYRALESLKTEMRAALDVVAVESQRLAEDMADFNQNRPAWTAYAIQAGMLEETGR